ncbi:MAG: O-antigen ligase family protein [Acidobacteria bacterium]|nr:O-antigen ligase family protein [Acidobacteriota bacterium]
MIRHLSWILVTLMGSAVIWAPLPFGSVTPWATAILQVTAFTLLGLALFRARSLEFFQPVLAPVAALAGITLLGLLQSASLPAAVVEVVSPAHAEIYRQASDLSTEAGGQPVPSRLTHSADVSRRTALTWAAWAALLAAAIVAGRHVVHRRWLGVSVLVAAGFQVLYGMERWLGAVSTIWEIPVPGAPDRLRGTFVNPDHFAFFLELALGVCFAWLWWAIRHWKRTESLEMRLLLVVPPVVLWIAGFVALAFSGSRGALLAALAGVAVQSLLLSPSLRRPRTLILGGGLLAGGLAGVAALGARYGFGRLLETSAYELTWGTRLQALGRSLELWRSYLWTGVGLGTFRDAFPAVQPPELAGTWSHAHSDLLELGVTTGVVGVCLAAVGLIFLLRRLGRVFCDALRSEDRAAALAAFGVLASALVHEALDFGLTMPANAFVLTVICGAACGARLAPPSAAEERRRFR